MSTRARIGIQLPDGKILSVYHHWDGYPDWLGVTLKEHYNTEKKALKLIEGGDMSCCWANDRFKKERKNHEHPLKTVKKFGPNYYSYRGEDRPPRLDDNRLSYICYGESYNYIFHNNTWICFDSEENEVVIP